MDTIEVCEVEIQSRNVDLLRYLTKTINKRSLNYTNIAFKRNGYAWVSFDLLEPDFIRIKGDYSHEEELSIRLTAQWTQEQPQQMLGLVGNKTKNNTLDAGFLNDINNFSAYTSIDELEKTVKALQLKFSTITRLFNVAHKTEEGNDTFALQLGSPCDNNKESLIIVGGMHADEWVATESLLYFAYAMCSAYQNNTDLVYNNLSYQAQDIKSLFEHYNLLLVPCLNPDGRAYSHNPNGDVNWRKNRSINSNGSYGVDINRNFDIAWDLEKFDSESVSSSSNMWSNVYHGSSPHSEKETLNLIDIFDHFKQCKIFIDVHASGDLILYPWAIDTNQFRLPLMNYNDSTHDGKRGKLSCDYAEYMPIKDHMEHVYFATAINEAICLGGNKRYTMIEASDLYNIGISGASPDYAYARHLENSQLNKIWGFTLECGDKEKHDVFSAKRPKPSHAKAIIKETCSALIGACQALQEGVPDL